MSAPNFGVCLQVAFMKFMTIPRGLSLNPRIGDVFVVFFNVEPRLWMGCGGPQWGCSLQRPLRADVEQGTAQAAVRGF